MISAEDRSGW